MKPEGRYHRSRSLRSSILCFTSTVTIVCLVIGYIIGGGFLFQYLEAEAEYERLKNGSERVKEYRQRFMRENKRQIQAYKDALVDRTKFYFKALNASVQSISAFNRSMGRSGNIPAVIVDPIVKLMKNMSFLHVENISTSVSQSFNKTNTVVTDNFIEEIYNTTMSGFIIDFDENNATLWTLSGAILYSVTVITTIGYGHIVPKTDYGKIATIIYAMFGIPLMLLCLANLGPLLADFFRWIYRSIVTSSRFCRSRIKKRSRNRNPRAKKKNKSSTISNKQVVDKHLSSVTKSSSDATKPDDCHSEKEKSLDFTLSTESNSTVEYIEIDTINLPLAFALLVFLIYILIGAFVITVWEGWTYLNSVYFVFITFSTIGFGDLVPGALNNKWSNQVTPISCALYLLFGLVLVSMCFQLMQDVLRKRARRMGQQMGLIN